MSKGIKKIDKRTNNGGHSTKSLDPNDRRKNQFKDVMQQAQKNRLKTIRDEALKQLDATRAMLLSQQNQNKR